MVVLRSVIDDARFSFILYLGYCESLIQKTVKPSHESFISQANLPWPDLKMLGTPNLHFEHKSFSLGHVRHHIHSSNCVSF